MKLELILIVYKRIQNGQKREFHSILLLLLIDFQVVIWNSNVTKRIVYKSKPDNFLDIDHKLLKKQKFHFRESNFFF